MNARREVRTARLASTLLRREIEIEIRSCCYDCLLRIRMLGGEESTEHTVYNAQSQFYESILQDLYGDSFEEVRRES